jgi:DNA-binding response OmpR family regulator
MTARPEPRDAPASKEPRKNPGDRGKSASGGPPSAAPERGAMKMVLVVEGEPEIRELLTVYLIRQSLISIPVPDGAHALVVCKTLAPDAVLLDLELIDTDSVALILQLKRQRPGTPLVVIAGALDTERETQCRAEGADDVLPKPIDLKRLGQILARLL